ncbi:MAG: TraV family lipoprotein [Nitrospiraceae bacterium]|nr:TraV family lipoprotein [Nitrospiraceae bacterium]
MRKLIFYFLLFLALALSGCAGAMNPYSSSFSCPNFKNGRCVSVETAYKDSTDGKYQDLWKESDAGKSKKEKAAPTEADLYQSALYGRLNGLLKSPVSPMVVPPQVMRVLILPYTGRDNELYMERYVYLFLSGPKWLLNDAVSRTAR